MKRLFLVAAALALFFCLASCGTVPKTEPSPAPEIQPAPVQTPTVVESVAESAPIITPEPAPVIEQTPVPTVPVAAPAPQSELPGEPVSDPAIQTVTVEGGGYSVEILSAFRDTDYTGAQVVVLKFLFTNNNSTASCFGNVADVTVRQNGSVLNGDSVIMDSNSFGGLAFNFRTSVSNGVSIPCVFAYPYNGDGDLNVSLQLLSDNNARQVLADGSAVLSIG